MARCRYIALAVTGLALGCSSREDPNQSPPADLMLSAPEPVRMLNVKSRTDLSGLLPADAVLAGVAIDPYDREHRYLLEAKRGIYRVGVDGAELVFSLPDATVSGGPGNGLPPAELTDIAVVRASPQRLEFVLTAENEGYSLTLGSSILNSYFCYFPNTAEQAAVNERPSLSEQLRADGVAIKERTHAVAVNLGTGQIST